MNIFRPIHKLLYKCKTFPNLEIKFDVSQQHSVEIGFPGQYKVQSIIDEKLRKNISCLELFQPEAL